MTARRGKLIVVEGLDRAGKSTQVERLVANLSAAGQQVEKVRFPDRSTPIGTSIDAYLKGHTQVNDHVIHLLFSANRWEASTSLTSKLTSGTTLIVDRYSFSGAVYSAAKHNPTLGLDWAWNMEIGLPQPDLVVYLTVSEEVQASRGGFGEERYENRAMQRAVREGFERLWERWEGNVGVVKADGSFEDVEERIGVLVKEVIDEGDRSLAVLQSLKPSR